MDNAIATREFFTELKDVFAEQNRTVLGKIGEVAKDVDLLKDDMSSMKFNVNHLMNERPINRREAGRMRRRAQRRICELLMVPTNKAERSLEQRIRYEKYHRALFGRLYAEVPNEGHMARSSYLDTPVKNYDAAMADIDSFVPACGMVNFMSEVDKDATAKVIAREQGY